MRLLDVHHWPPISPIDLTEVEVETRPYAILSHVWDDEEVVFGDLQQPQRLPTNHDKISGAQTQAKSDELDYIWIDTLCIDKGSSSELGEAINSMFRWYQGAAVCYVYLSDLDGCPRLTDEDILHFTSEKTYWGTRFRQSRWFRRGWTLQELIAPRRVQFFDKSWNFIGTLEDLATSVSDITKVHLTMLRHESEPKDFSIAQRMSWAARRVTTRSEDRAYSLLGVLDITISIRYGEGMQAFVRLQEAIIARDADQSIFAWEEPLRTLIKQEKVVDCNAHPNGPMQSQLLAASPDAFARARAIVPSKNASLPYRMTNLGLYITSPVPGFDQNTIILNCHYQDDPTKAILLKIERREELTIRSEESQGFLPPETMAHVRPRSHLTDVRSTRIKTADVDLAHRHASPHTFYISREFAAPAAEDQSCKVWLQVLESCGSPLDEMQPRILLRSESSVSKLSQQTKFHSSNPVHDLDSSNLTWTFSNDLEPSTREYHSLSTILLHSLLANGFLHVDVGIALDGKVGLSYLRLAAEDPQRPKEKFESLTHGTISKLGVPLLGQLFLNAELTLRASLQRQEYNGQVMHIVKVCSVWVRKSRWKLEHKRYPCRSVR